MLFDFSGDISSKEKKRAESVSRSHTFLSIPDSRNTIEDIRQDYTGSPEHTFSLLHFYHIVKRLFLQVINKSPCEEISPYYSGRPEAGARLADGISLV
jgi:hypothetical protein